MDLFKEDGVKAGLQDIVEWWLYWYPDDVFINSPPLIVKITKEMMKLKERI